MNSFINNLKEETNYTYTENGALTHSSTLNKVYDMFALGGSYRKRTDEDCALLFKKAFEENKDLALKCLFYLRDVRGGQGERRYFRVCISWLAAEYPDILRKNLENIPEYGRWDDLLYLLNTRVHYDVLELIKKQLSKDISSLEFDSKAGISLLGKWLPSENASSKTTKDNADIIRKYLKLSHRNYRKLLSGLRSRINIVETLMSQNRWNEIQFDKIPSKAGFIYRNAFARKEAERYKEFMDSKETKVNAKTLYPYDIAHMAFNSPTERQAIQKYWDNLPDYYDGKEENGLAIVDTSGSMSGMPLEAAVSLGAYIAERGHGQFANHFITFSSEPELIEFEGLDIVDKFQRARRASWEGNTDLKAVFDLLLDTAKKNSTLPEDMPTRLYIFSDMEFDRCLWTSYSIPTYIMGYKTTKEGVLTLIEEISKQWEREGYKIPEIIFWNLDARNNNIPALIGGKFSYISGLSPIMIQTVLSGKTGIDLMIEKLVKSGRYDKVIAD